MTIRTIKFYHKIQNDNNEYILCLVTIFKAFNDQGSSYAPKQ